MSAKDQYDYDIFAVLPSGKKEIIRGSCYGAEHMIQAIEQHYPDYVAAVISFTIIRDAAKAT